MQIIPVSQSDDRSAWLDMRNGVITGTKVKGIMPADRSKATPVGIFTLLAEQVAIAKDGEPERERGLRLEDEALMLTQEKYKLDLDLDCGMWLSEDGKLGVSPDAAQVGKKPKYAAEAKCLDSQYHLQCILNDVASKKLPNYNPLNSLKFGTHDFTFQVKQYFVINKELEIVYFTLYDDRIVLENVMHYVIKIERKDVEEFIESQELCELNALKIVDEMIKTLKGIK